METGVHTPAIADQTSNAIPKLEHAFPIELVQWAERDQVAIMVSVK